MFTKELDNEEKVPIPRDTERFKLLFTNSRPKLPAGYTAPLYPHTTRELIAKRLSEPTEAA